MNSFTNAILLFLFIPIMALAVAVGFNLPMDFIKTSGANLPYQKGIFIGLAIVIFLISVLRSIKRWVGIYMANKIKRFKATFEISKERKYRVIVYTLLESMVLISMGLGLFFVAKASFYCSMVFWFFAFDGIVFLIFGYRKFRVCISTKALMVADRELTIVYFSGLRKISQSQQTLYFDYIKELQLSFPLNCISDEQKKEFVTSLETNIDPNKVLVYNLGEWKK